MDMEDAVIVLGLIFLALGVAAMVYVHTHDVPNKGMFTIDARPACTACGNPSCEYPVTPACPRCGNLNVNKTASEHWYECPMHKDETERFFKV